MKGLLALLSAVSLLSGLITAVASLRAGRAEGDMRKVGERVAGTVVSTKRMTSPQGKPLMYPEVRFTTATGRQVRGVSLTPVTKEWPVDSPIEVRYDPNAPKQFHAGPSAARMYGIAATLFLVIGAVCAIQLLI